MIAYEMIRIHNDVRKKIYQVNWIFLLQYYANTPSLPFLFDIVIVRHVQG